jgi:hypothetical protein
MEILAVMYRITGNLEVIETTSKGYDQAPHPVLWRVDIGCIEREGLQCRVRCENEVAVGICVLRRRGRLCHEALYVPTRCGRIVYA